MSVLVVDQLVQALLGRHAHQIARPIQIGGGHLFDHLADLLRPDDALDVRFHAGRWRCGRGRCVRRIGFDDTSATAIVRHNDLAQLGPYRRPAGGLRLLGRTDGRRRRVVVVVVRLMT